MDDSDGDDEVRPCIPCPYCHVDIEAHLLCNHWQDEQCFDLKNADCSLCAVNLGKDATAHVMVQHASSLKHWRKRHKRGIWSGNTAKLGKELSKFIGSSTNGRTNTQEPAPDPLLSPFLNTVLQSDPKRRDENDSFNKNTPLPSDIMEQYIPFKTLCTFLFVSSVLKFKTHHCLSRCVIEN